jgi:TP901 family phage tail tape measure protein
MASRNAGTIFISLQLATESLQAGFAQVDKQLKNFAANAQNIGRTLSVAVSVPLGLFGRSAVKAFADFDSAMTNSMSVMDNVSATMKNQLVKGAEDVARATGISAAKTAEGYYFLASSGLSAQQSLEALPVVARFATAGHVDLAKATELLSGSQAALGLRMEDPIENMRQMTRVSDVLTKANIVSDASIEEMGEAMARVGGILSTHNQSLEDGASILAAFARSNLKGVSAGTALSIVIRDLSEKAIKNEKAWESFGVKVYDANGMMRSATQIIPEMADKLSKMSNIQASATLANLGFTQKTNGFIKRVLSMSEVIREFSGEMENAGGVTKSVSDKQLMSFQSQLNMLGEKFASIKRGIGEILAPEVLRLGEKLLKVAEAFQELNPGTQEAIIKFAAFATILGPIVLGVATLMKLFIGIGKPLLAAGAALFTLAKGGAVAGVAIASIGTVLGGITLVLGVAAGAWLIWGDDIKRVLSDVWETIVGWGTSLQETFPGFFTAFEAVGILIQEVWNDILVYGAEKIQSLGEEWDRFTDKVVEVYNTVKNVIGSFFDWIQTNAPALYKGLTDPFIWAEQIITGVGKRIRAVFDFITDVAADAVFAVQKGAQDVVKAQQSLDAQIRSQGRAQTDKDLGTVLGIGFQFAKEKADSLIGSVGGLNKVAETTKKIVDNYEKSLKRKGGIGVPVPGSRDDLFGAKDEAKAAKKRESEAKKRAREQESEDKKREQAIKRQTDALDNLRDKLADIQNDNVTKGLEEGLRSAIETSTPELFNNLKERLRQNIYEGTLAGLQEGVEKAGNTAEARALAEGIATAKSDESLRKWEEDYAESSKKNAEQLQKDQEDAYKESLDYWRDTFKGIMSGETLDLKDLFTDFVAELGAQVAAATSEGMSAGANDAKGSIGQSLGSALASAFSGKGGGGGGGTGGGLASAISSLFSSMGSGGSGGAPAGGEGGGFSSWMSSIFGNKGMTTTEAHNAGIQGPGLPNGQFNPQDQGAGGYIAAGLQTIMAAINSSKIDKEHQDNRGTGGAIGGGIGGTLGAIFGGGPGAQIGAQIGNAVGSQIGKYFKWGPQNPETQARHAFANFIEESFEKLKQVSFFDANKRIKTVAGKDYNFLEGPSNKFNDPKWADALLASGDKVKGTFLGMGEAMRQLLGIAEDVGPQIGALLFENMGGSIDNLRLLVMQLGLSAEDLTEKLVAAGESGQLSWHEVEVGLQGVAEAFKPGLEAVGDVQGAFQQLIDSGGRGLVAIKAVKDLAIEAAEAGGKTLQDLQAMLLAKGIDPSQVEALMAALQQRGVTTLQQLAEVSNRVGGGIVADIESASGSMASTWASMTQQLKDVGDQLNNLPKEVESRIHLVVDADVSDAAQAVLDKTEAGNHVKIPNAPKPPTPNAKGAVLTKPTFFAHQSGVGVAGEAGAEAIMPLTKVGGVLGVKSVNTGAGAAPTSITFHIDARGDDSGVEKRVEYAMRKWEGRLTGKAVNRVYDLARRGGSFSDALGD